MGKVNQYFYSTQLLNVMIRPPYQTGSSQLATIWQWWGPWLNIHATLRTTNLLAPTRLYAFPVENMMKIHPYVKVRMRSFGTKLSPKLELTCAWGWCNTSMYGQICLSSLSLSNFSPLNSQWRTEQDEACYNGGISST